MANYWSFMLQRFFVCMCVRKNEFLGYGHSQQILMCNCKWGCCSSYNEEIIESSTRNETQIFVQNLFYDIDNMFRYYFIISDLFISSAWVSSRANFYWEFLYFYLSSIFFCFLFSFFISFMWTTINFIFP